MNNRTLGTTDIIGLKEEPEVDRPRDRTWSSNNHSWWWCFDKPRHSKQGKRVGGKTAKGL